SSLATAFRKRGWSSRPTGSVSRIDETAASSMAGSAWSASSAARKWPSRSPRFDPRPTYALTTGRGYLGSVKALALVLVVLATAPAAVAGHRLRTAWPPQTPAAVGSTPNVLVQVDPARPAVISLLRGSGAELLSRQLHLWRVRSGAAESL